MVKDLISQDFVDDGTLHFRGWLGNSRHGVALPLNYRPCAGGSMRSLPLV
jgi:hypothetical protein